MVSVEGRSKERWSALKGDQRREIKGEMVQYSLVLNLISV